MRQPLQHRGQQTWGGDWGRGNGKILVATYKGSLEEGEIAMSESFPRVSSESSKKKFVSMIPSLHDQHLLLLDFRAGKLEALLKEADALL